MGVFDNKKMRWAVMDQMYNLHGQMVAFEGLARFLKTGKDDAAAFKSLSGYVDVILFGSKVLSETCLYFSKVAADKQMSELILYAGTGLASKNNPFTKERLAEVEPRLKGLINDYMSAINRSIQEMLSKAVSPEKIKQCGQMLPGRLCQLACWMVKEDEPGAKVINNVWLPKESAEPLLKKLIDEQVQAMAAKTIKKKE